MSAEMVAVIDIHVIGESQMRCKSKFSKSLMWVQFEYFRISGEVFMLVRWRGSIEHDGRLQTIEHDAIALMGGYKANRRHCGLVQRPAAPAQTTQY